MCKCCQRREEQEVFDFISYARDTGMTINIIPGRKGVLVSLEIVSPDGYIESCDITDDDARHALNIDAYTGKILDAMSARIGKRKAEDYSRMHKGNQMRERERFFRCE